MKSVTIMKVLVMVFAFSRTFVSGVFLSPGVEDGGQGGQRTGTQRYDREFLISLQPPPPPPPPRSPLTFLSNFSLLR